MKSYGQYCGLALALDRVGPRWTLLVVRELLVAPRRFTDLMERMPRVPRNLLASRLRQMEKDGLIARRTLPGPGRAVVYQLTKAGRELEEAVHALVRWGGRFMTQPPRRMEFRSDWLVVAIAALVGGRRMDKRLELELRVAGNPVRVTAGRSGVSVAPESNPGAQLTIIASAPALLGVFAGALSLEQAERSAGMVVAGSATARAALSRLVAKPPGDETV